MPQVKACAAFAVACTAGGGVYCEHQGFVACRLCALHQCAGEAPVVLQVELKPQRATRRVVQKDLGHFFQRRAGLGAEHHACTQRSGRIGAGPFSVGVGQPLVGHRGQQNGVGQRAPQQGGAGVAAGKRAQYARLQGEPVPGAAVGAQCDFVRSAAAEIGPGGIVQALACMLRVVGQGHGVFWNRLALQ